MSITGVDRSAQSVEPQEDSKHPATLPELVWEPCAPPPCYVSPACKVQAVSITGVDRSAQSVEPLEDSRHPATLQELVWER